MAKAKLHSLLAAEKSVTEAAAKIMAETEVKMGKEATYFTGHLKTLKLIKDSPSKTAEESAGSERKSLNSTVPETLEYALGYWAKAEDVLFQKNRTNQIAIADIMFNGAVLATDVPVDQLLGLEARLLTLRALIAKLPTLDASKKWERKQDQGKHVWQTEAVEVTTKTEKIVTPVVLYHATDKHPAQIKETAADVVIGSFEVIRQSGAITSRQKADSLSAIDALIVEVKKSRSRANEVEVVDGTLANSIINVVFGNILNPSV